MLVVQIMFALVFLFAVEYLKIEKNIVAAQLEQVKNQDETKEMNDIEKNLAEYGKKIESIDDLRKEHLRWSYVFEEIIGILPDGVRLEGISSQLVIDKAVKADIIDEKFRIDLTGNALTRKDLLAFEEKLKSADLFSEVECDDSNYVKSSDIDFRYSFYVYKKKLLE
jgi:Tfp pilus assembly protein PilN